MKVQAIQRGILGLCVLLGLGACGGSSGSSSSPPPSQTPAAQPQSSDPTAQPQASPTNTQPPATNPQVPATSQPNKPQSGNTSQANATAAIATGQPLIEQYCAGCHAGNNAPKQIHLDSQSGIQSNAGIASNELQVGRMPPPNGAQPSASDKAKMLAAFQASGS